MSVLTPRLYGIETLTFSQPMDYPRRADLCQPVPTWRWERVRVCTREAERDKELPERSAEHWIY